MNQTNSPSTVSSAMPLIPALEVLRDARGESIVITTMGSAREWPRISRHPLDFHYVPSSMGQAPALGLGLALAQPDRKVIALNGDGCMLMNLGSLVTITAQAPKNYALIVLDNGVYEVTGRQPTAGSASGRTSGTKIDFSGLARAAGYKMTFPFHELDRWRDGVAEVLAAEGPVFVTLDIQPVTEGDVSITAPGPIQERLARFREALGTAS